MKLNKLVTTILALVLSLILCASTVSAENFAFDTEAVTEKDITVGMDVVILLDSSKSMYDTPGNDRTYQRLDAAAMMINMCDANNSSVAVVPFTAGDRLVKGTYWGSFVDVTVGANRSALCDAVLDCEVAAGASDYTLFSAAYDEAINLMKSVQDRNTRKIVILLSDGGNQRESGAEFDQKVEELNSLVDSVYSIFLSRTNDGAAMDKMRSLAYSADNNAMAVETHYFYGTDANIVEIFSQVFAQEIGSEKKTIVATQTSDTQVEVTLNIPNNSIHETNIEIPVGLLAENAVIKITDEARGVTYTKSDENVVIYEHRKNAPSTKQPYEFVSIKLKQPKAGKWIISFDKDEKAQTDVFSCDLLYNYNVSLTGKVLNEGPVHMNDTLKVMAYFVDEKTLMPSDDYNLYNPYDANEDTGMRATVTIRNENEILVQDEPMVNMTNEGYFALELPLDGQRKNRGWYDDGNFTVQVHVEGDSLKRDLIQDLTFTTENRAPVVANYDAAAAVASFKIGQLEAGNGADAPTVDASVFFTDPDGDALTYHIEDNDFAVIDAATGLITFNPPADIEGKENVLQTEVWATDVMGLASEKQTVTMNVVHMANNLREVFENNAPATVEVTMTDAEGNVIEDPSNVAKGTKVRITAHTVPNKLLAASYADFADELQPEVLAEHVVNTIQADREDGVEYGEDENGDIYAEYAFGDTQDSVTFEVASEFTFDGVLSEPMALSCSENSVAFKAVNNAPEAVTDFGDELKTNVNIDGTKQQSFAVADFFTDEDVLNGHDELTYQGKAVYSRNGEGWKSFALSILRVVGLAGKDNRTEQFDLVDENGTYNLDYKASGEYTVTLTATDLDEVSTDNVLTIKTSSAKETTLAIVLYVILLVLLIAILAFLKNRFITHSPWPNRQNSCYTIEKNGILQKIGTETQFYFGFSGRSAKTLSNVYPFNSGSAIDAQIMEALKTVAIWPTTGKAVVVEPKKKNASITQILVNGKKIGKKGKWTPGGTVDVAINFTDGGVCSIKWTRVKGGTTTGGRKSAPTATSSRPTSGGIQNF